MSTAMVVGNEKVHEAKDYKISKKLNDIDVITFVANNDAINRNRFALENDVYSELLRDWGVITRVKIEQNKIKVTWEQRCWHLKRRVYSSTGFNGVASDVVSNIIGSANNDSPFSFNVGFQGNVSTTVKGKLRYNTHFDALQSVCNAGNFSMRFKGTTVEFGKFSNVINVSDDKGIVNKLKSDQDLNKFGNVFYMLGNDGELKRTIDSSIESPTRYRYDRVISSSKIDDADDVANVFLEYGNVKPIVDFEVSTDVYVNYQFDVGDVLKVDMGDINSGNNGFYRIVKMDVGFPTTKLYLEFSTDGTFSSRTFDPGDTLRHLGKKIRELEVYK